MDRTEKDHEIGKKTMTNSPGFISGRGLECEPKLLNNRGFACGEKKKNHQGAEARNKMSRLT